MTELLQCGLCEGMHCLKPDQGEGRLLVVGESAVHLKNPIEKCRIRSRIINQQIRWEAQENMEMHREDDALRNDFEVGFEPGTDYMGL